MIMWPEREREEDGGLGFMYVFFNVNLSGGRKKERMGEARMNLYECFPGGGGAYIRCPG